MKSLVFDTGPIITLTSIIAGIEFGLKHFRKKEGDEDVRK